jgi:hypothetical protein
MAGVKVTDLTPLATAASDDIFYIVDTSSNTSKQIEVQDIYSGMPQFESGTFSPTVSNIVPNTTIVAVLPAFYQKVGNIVTMSTFFDVSFGGSDSSVAFNIDLPVSSDFTNIKDIQGCIVPDNWTDFLGANIVADDTLDLALITVDTATAGSTYTYIRTVFQYEIK